MNQFYSTFILELRVHARTCTMSISTEKSSFIQQSHETNDHNTT